MMGIVFGFIVHYFQKLDYSIDITWYSLARLLWLATDVHWSSIISRKVFFSLSQLSTYVHLSNNIRPFHLAWSKWRHLLSKSSRIIIQRRCFKIPSTAFMHVTLKNGTASTRKTSSTNSFVGLWSLQQIRVATFFCLSLNFFQFSTQRRIWFG